MVPDGLAHELRAVFRDAHGPWGALILLRADDARDFAEEEVALVAGISEQVTRALRRVLLLGEIEAQSGAEAPALLLLEGDTTLSVRHASATAAHWLAQMEDSTVEQLPYALYSVAQQARARGHGVTRIRTRAGRWLTAHAEAVAGSGEVSLILQPSRPHEIAQVLAGAYALTPREAEVARLVAAGLLEPRNRGPAVRLALHGGGPPEAPVRKAGRQQPVGTGVAAVLRPVPAPHSGGDGAGWNGVVHAGEVRPRRSTERLAPGSQPFRRSCHSTIAGKASSGIFASCAYGSADAHGKIRHGQLSPSRYLRWAKCRLQHAADAQTFPLRP